MSRDEPTPSGLPPRPLTPRQALRAAEAYAAFCTIEWLRDFWRQRVVGQSEETIEDLFVSTARLLPPGLRSMLAAHLDSAEPEEADDFLVLRESTRMFVRLELPLTRAEVFAGPPILQRLGSSG